MTEPTRPSERQHEPDEVTREEKRFNLVLRGVFILLLFMMIIMTLIWQLATPGSLLY